MHHLASSPFLGSLSVLPRVGGAPWEGTPQERLASLQAQGNAPGALAFAREGTPGTPYEDLQAIVLTSGAPEVLALYAATVPSASAPLLQAQAEALGDPGALVIFGSLVPRASVPSLQDHLLRLASHRSRRALEALCDFALEVPGASVPLLETAVLQGGDAFIAYRFAKTVEGASLLPLTTLVMEGSLPPAVGEGDRQAWLRALQQDFPQVLSDDILGNLRLKVTL